MPPLLTGLPHSHYSGTTLCHRPHSIQGPVTLSSRWQKMGLPLLPGSQGWHTHSAGSGTASSVQKGADRKQCSPRKSSKENLSLSQIWNTTRAGILLSVLSSLQKASWPRRGSRKARLERGNSPFQPGSLPGGGSPVGQPLRTCQSQVLAGRLLRPQRTGPGRYHAGSLHISSSFNPPNSVSQGSHSHFTDNETGAWRN